MSVLHGHSQYRIVSLRQNMAYKAFVQQITKHLLCAATEVGTKTIGEQKAHTARNITGK
jgi:hypothetical protein